MPDFEWIVIYTTERGGIMHPFWSSPEEYEKIKIQGWINEHPEQDYETRRPLKMVALCRVDQMHDFILKGDRIPERVNA